MFRIPNINLMGHCCLQCKNEAVPVAVHLSAQDTPYDQQLQQAADQYLSKTGKQCISMQHPIRLSCNHQY